MSENKRVTIPFLAKVLKPIADLILTKADKTDIYTKEELASVATTGSYNDLSNTPVIDTTLSVDGAVAEAKATGDAIGAVSDLVGDVAVATQITEAIGAIPQADWNQNDENAPDYVKNRTHYDTRVEITWNGDTTDKVMAEQIKAGATKLILARVSNLTPSPEVLAENEAVITYLVVDRKGVFQVDAPNTATFSGATSQSDDGWYWVNNNVVLVVAYAAGYEFKPMNATGTYRAPGPGIYFAITQVRSKNYRMCAGLAYNELKVLDNKYIEPFVVKFSYKASDYVRGGTFVGITDKTYAEIRQAFTGPNLAFAYHGYTPLHIVNGLLSYTGPIVFSSWKNPRGLSGSASNPYFADNTGATMYYAIYPDNRVEVTEFLKDPDWDIGLNKEIVYRKLGCLPVSGFAMINVKPVTMPVENGVYTVLWNDVPYECTGIVTTVEDVENCIVLGNTAKLGIEGGSDVEPFSFVFLPLTAAGLFNGARIFVHDEALYNAAATFEIHEKTSTANKRLVTDEHGNTMWADIPTVVQPDWNQNDETASDHVLNRTHWSENNLVDVLTETTVAFTDGEAGLTDAPLFYPSVGQKCVVTWNGTEYEYVAAALPLPTGNDVIVIGNAGLLGGEDNGGEFCIAIPAAVDVAEVGAAIIFGWPNGAETATVAIKVNVETVHKLDSKFIESFDWNAAEGETGHILNRTHYDEVAILDIIPNGTYTLSERVIPFTEKFPNSMVVGEKYTVNWNGTAYECVAGTIELDGITAVTIGNIAMAQGTGDTGEPFVILEIPEEHVATVGAYGLAQSMTDPGTAEISLSVTYTGTVTHKLDPKYVHTPDWNASEGEPGYIANRTHWVTTKPIEILPQVEFAATNDESVQITTRMTNIPTAGETYSVTYNGTAYECVAEYCTVFDVPGYVFGRTQMFGGSNKTGDFAIILFESALGTNDDGTSMYGIAILYANEADTNTIAIEQPAGMVHKLDAKFLPDTVVTDTEAAGILTEAKSYTDTEVANVLTDAKSYTDAEVAAITVPVDSVNGKTGAVVLSAADVGALPVTTDIPSTDGLATEDYVDTQISAIDFPVDSVNGKTGAVVLTASDVDADAKGAAAAAIKSLNIQNGYANGSLTSVSGSWFVGAYVTGDANAIEYVVDSEYERCAPGFQVKYNDVTATIVRTKELDSGERIIVLSNTLSDSAIVHGQLMYCGASATGFRSIAFGDLVMANGEDSFSLGEKNKVYGNCSGALGTDIVVHGEHAFATGFSIIANTGYLTVHGQYNEYEHLQNNYVDWKLTDNRTVTYSSTLYKSSSPPVLNDTTGLFEFENYVEVVDRSEIVAGDYIMAGLTYKIYDKVLTVLSCTDTEITVEGEAHASLSVHGLRGKYAYIIGNGDSSASRSNAHVLDWDGNARYAGDVYVQGTGTTGDLNDAKKLATEEYVETVVANSMIISSSTEGSTKKFRITVDDTGALTAVEITE